MLYHEVECKGTSDGIRALSLIKREFPGTRVILFGMYHRPDIGFESEYYEDPPYKQLLGLYQSADIYLFPSHGEGWGMTPMEAMACKCAVVGTCVGSIKEVYNGNNAIIIHPKSPESAYGGIKTLILDLDKRERIAEEGYKCIQKYKWEYMARKLEDTFKKISS